MKNIFVTLSLLLAQPSFASSQHYLDTLAVFEQSRVLQITSSVQVYSGVCVSKHKHAVPTRSFLYFDKDSNVIAEAGLSVSTLSYGEYNWQSLLTTIGQMNFKKSFRNADFSKMIVENTPRGFNSWYNLIEFRGSEASIISVQRNFSADTQTIYVRGEVEPLTVAPGEIYAVCTYSRQYFPLPGAKQDDYYSSSNISNVMKAGECVEKDPSAFASSEIVHLPGNKMQLVQKRNLWIRMDNGQDLRPRFHFVGAPSKCC